MLLILGEGTVKSVDVTPGAKLKDVLASAELEYNSDFVYRGVEGELDLDSVVQTDGVLVFAAAEDNGLRGLR